MTDTIPCTDFDLDKVVLLGGGHGDFYHGECCFVEAANVAAACIPELREKYGAAPFMADHPSISPVIRGFSISWNDGMNEEDRNRILKPRITQILGTKTTTGGRRNSRLDGGRLARSRPHARLASPRGLDQGSAGAGRNSEDCRRRHL
jgi:hypothetical protein